MMKPFLKEEGKNADARQKTTKASQTDCFRAWNHFIEEQKSH